MALNLHEDAFENKSKSFDESSHGSSSWSLDPSSSTLSSSFGSELDSIDTQSQENEDDEEDFMAELTRQMANYMLEDDNNNNGDTDVPNSITSIYNCHQRFINSSIQPFEMYRNQNFCEGQMKSIEVYELKNQPSVKERGNACSRKREKTESAHRFNSYQVQQKGQNKGKGYVVKGRVSSQNGSGMTKAVFLGGSRSGYGSCGTGVFLPRVIDNQTTHPKKKSGCSTVLIPAKVLHALEFHFNNTEHTNHNQQGKKSQQKRSSEFQIKAASNNQEMLVLPEEWTY